MSAVSVVHQGNEKKTNSGDFLTYFMPEEGKRQKDSGREREDTQTQRINHI